jgi:LysR family transcriptional regulator for metE and metH
MRTPLELRHLRTFHALAESTTLTQAAERLFISQSALSQQLKLLEDVYDLPLVERRTQPLCLTTAGQRLAQAAQRVLHEVALLEQDLTKLSHTDSGPLRVAVECNTCFDWLMPAMDAFRPRWDAVDLDIVSGFHADPVSLLLEHRAELAITAENDGSGQIEFFPLFSYEMLAVVSREHEWASFEYVALSDFAEQTLITYPIPDAMLDIMRVLKPLNIFPQRRTTELTIAILQLVASGRGVGVLPNWGVQSYVDKQYVCAKSIGESGLHGTFYAAVRTADAGRVYVQDFIELLRSTCRDNLRGITLLS